MPLSAKQIKENEEEMILKARLELAEMAIARQRARRVLEASGSDASAEAVTAALATTTVSAVPVVVEKDAKQIEEEEEAIRAEEKANAKAKRKIEKDAIAAEEKREEEGREKRRLEKIRDNEEAKKMKEEQARQFEEFLLVKAARDVRPYQRISGHFFLTTFSYPLRIVIPPFSSYLTRSFYSPPPPKHTHTCTHSTHPLRPHAQANKKSHLTFRFYETH